MIALIKIVYVQVFKNWSQQSITIQAFFMQNLFNQKFIVWNLSSVEANKKQKNAHISKCKKNSHKNYIDKLIVFKLFIRSFILSKVLTRIVILWSFLKFSQNSMEVVSQNQQKLF